MENIRNRAFAVFKRKLNSEPVHNNDADHLENLVVCILIRR